MYFSRFLLILSLLICLVQPQMMPVPDQPDDSSNSRPDPFTVPQFSKFYKPLIVQLNESSFQEIIQNFPKIVVLFRTIKSPEIFETFKALAQDLKRNHKVIFGIYNVSLEEATHIQKKNNLKRLPSIIFIEKTKKTNFFGSLDNQTELNNFLTDFLIKELIELKTHEDFLKFYNKPNQTKLLAIYQADMVKEKKLLEEMIKKELFEDSGPFVIGWTSDQSIIPIPSNVEMPSLILYNTFKEEDGEVIVTYEGNFKEGDNILSFCQLRSLPIVSEYNDDTSFRLFGGGVDTQMLLFLQEKMDNTLIIKEFKKAAKYNKEEELHYERIMFAIVYDQDENQEFLDFFGITSEQDLETPKVFLTKIDNRLQKLDKYLYEKDEINEEYIKDFIGEFRKKEIPRFFKSERVPDNTNKWPLNMVGSEFNKEVIRSKDNYFVLFCSNYQEQVCKGAAKYFEKISMKINENDREIVKFASFDIDKNEVDGLEIDTIPTMRIYLKGEKKKPKVYKGDVDLLKILEFFRAYFSSKIEIGTFTTEEIEEIALELMSEEDRNSILEARGINLKELNNEESQEILEGIEEEEVNNITEKKSEL